MQSNRAIIVVLAFGLSIAEAGPDNRGDSDAPAEQYQALLKEYELASSSGRELTDEERMEFVGKTYKLRNKLALKFLELAEKYPQDAIAVDCLIQAVRQVNGTPWPVELVGADEAQARALDRLQRDHIRSEKLGLACERVSYGYCREYETFLRTVLEKSPHREVRAQACLGLARFLAGRFQRLELIREEPELGKEFADLFGKEYLETLQWQDRDKALREAETFFEQAAQTYGDVKPPGGGSVADDAAAELYEIRNLIVGRLAPDIDGQDQEGREFKLSDYRGKVVLLDFWSEA